MIIHQILIEAFEGKQVVRISYRTRGGKEATTRDIEIYQLGYWYVEAVCRSSGEPRSFRRDRIEHAELVSEHFEPKPGLVMFFDEFGWQKETPETTRGKAHAQYADPIVFTALTYRIKYEDLQATHIKWDWANKTPSRETEVPKNPKRAEPGTLEVIFTIVVILSALGIFGRGVFGFMDDIGGLPFINPQETQVRR